MWRAGRALGFFIGVALACGGRSGEVELGGETNWFGWCESSADCLAGGDCVCGICTVECSPQAPSCSGGPPGSTCALPNNGGFPGLCSGEAPPGLCLAQCSGAGSCSAELDCVGGWCIAPDGPSSLGPTGGGPEPSGSLCADSSVLDGVWEVRTAEELERFRGCTEIGELIIDTLLVPSLDPLSALRVAGGLSAGPGLLAETPSTWPLMRLTGLGSLERAGTLFLSSFDDADLGVLAGLERVGDLHLGNFPNVQSLSALAGASVERELSVREMPLLSDLAGPALAPGLQRLSLVNLPALSDLEPVRGLTSLEFLSVAATAAATLDALSRVESLADAVITDNPNLVHVGGLAALRSVGSLYISNNARLENADGIAGLQTLSVLGINDNPALTRLPEFAALSSGDMITIERNAQLRSGPSFPRLETGNARISGNPRLDSLAGLAGLGFAGSEVSIFDNDSLREIDLGALRYAGDLTIRNNRNLVLLDVSGLRSIGRLGVSDNPSLGAEGISAHPDVADRFGLPAEAP